MFFIVLLFLIGPGFTLAKNGADSFVSTNLNAILLMCPNDTNKDWTCVHQLIININFTPNLNVNNVDKLLILDETYEPTKRQTLKIMSPYIIVITRSEPTTMFPLVTSSWTNFNKHSYNLSSSTQGNPVNSNSYNITYHTQKLNMKEIQQRINNSIPSNIYSKLIKNKRENPYLISNSSVQESHKENLQNIKSDRGKITVEGNPNILKSIKPTDKPPEFSIYNLSTPFPYLAAKIRIFRKRKQTWWRIMPVISLNNLSGTFVNGNISVLLTSHEDILHKQMPLFLENYQLLIPTNLFNNPKELEGLRIYKSIFLKLFNNNTDKFLNFDNTKKIMTYKLKDKQKNQNVISKINNPTSLNILSKCPNNNKSLCLNVLDDQVPAFDIKIKMPFLENAAKQNILKVKISRIVTDATTKDALQISVDVINKGLNAQEFLISVCDCPLSESQTESTTTVKKMLLPYISETVTFLLPLLMGSKKSSKFTCDVVVKAFIHKRSKRLDLKEPTNILIVSRRSMEIETHSRCFCVWNCRCHCIGKIETHSDDNACQRMNYASEKEAGLLLNCPTNGDFNDFCSMDLNQEKILNNSSSNLVYKMFVFLTLLIVLCLLVLYCCKCFTPRKEDLIVASTEWFCAPENNLITCSRYNYKLRQPSRSVCTSTYSNRYFTKADVIPSNDVSICPSTDLLESALVTLARQQKDLRKQSMKKEW